MQKDISQKISKINEKSYQEISTEFWQTRLNLWQDFEVIGDYIEPGNSILDIGCGNGRLFELFKDKDISYTGLDLNPNFIREANKKYADFKQSRFYEGDLLSLSNNKHLVKKKFDIVFCIAVLNHIPDRSLRLQALNQIYSVLKPGGFLIMTNWNMWQLNYKRKTFFKYFLQKMRMSNEDFRKVYGVDKTSLGYKDIMTLWQADKKSVPLYYHAFTCREISYLCSRTAFRIVKSYYSKKGEKAHWWNGYNIITIAKNI